MLEANFIERANFRANMQEVVEVTREVEVEVETVTRDHTLLTNRDAANQHSIASITGLWKQLNSKMGEGNALTNIEIEEILK